MTTKQHKPFALIVNTFDNCFAIECEDEEEVHDTAAEVIGGWLESFEQDYKDEITFNEKDYTTTFTKKAAAAWDDIYYNSAVETGYYNKDTEDYETNDYDQGPLSEGEYDFLWWMTSEELARNGYITVVN